MSLVYLELPWNIYIKTKMPVISSVIFKFDLFESFVKKSYFRCRKFNGRSMLSVKHFTITLTKLERVQSRRQVKKCHKMFKKNVKIFKFHGYIWNQHGKCIQISTNMPSIGLVIHKITFKILRILDDKLMPVC